MVYNDKTVYEGYWINGKKEGQGYIQRLDGSTYQGSFVNDFPHGFGTEKSCEKTFVGTFKNSYKDHGLIES